jgi:hypothetical protein
MPKKSKPTFQKREKEKARQQKNKAKQERRLEAKDRRANTAPRLEGEDPDIAGIRPGPQPLPPQWDYIAGRGEEAPEKTQDDSV